MFIKKKGSPHSASQNFSCFSELHFRPLLTRKRFTTLMIRGDGSDCRVPVPEQRSNGPKSTQPVSRKLSFTGIIQSDRTARVVSLTSYSAVSTVSPAVLCGSRSPWLQNTGQLALTQPGRVRQAAVPEGGRGSCLARGQSRYRGAAPAVAAKGQTGQCLSGGCLRQGWQARWDLCPSEGGSAATVREALGRGYEVMGTRKGWGAAVSLPVLFPGATLLEGHR